MNKRKTLVTLKRIAVAGWLAFSLAAAATPALAQGHAGHTAQPAPSPAADKPAVAKPAAPPAQTAEVVPQVEISPEQQQRIGVKSVKAAVRPLQKVIRTVGRIEADERRQTTINTKIEGWIEKLYVDYTGRSVKKGEPLAEIYSPELLATQQEFLNVRKWAGRKPAPLSEAAGAHGAQAAAAVAPAPVTALQGMLAQDAASTLEAARQRLRLWDISEEQIRKIEETGQPIRNLTLYSPVSGIVVQKMAVQGMRVMPGEKLFDVTDLSSLWIVADIYEYELSLVRIGQPVRISLGYLPGRDLLAHIDYIYPSVAADTRTTKVRMTIPNPDGRLKPQMYSNIEIRVDLGSRLAIPESAVIDAGRSQVVYVDRGNGVFEPREIQTGLRADGVVEVLKGLKAGEKVASSANFLIDSEAQLKGVKPLPRP